MKNNFGKYKKKPMLSFWAESEGPTRITHGRHGLLQLEATKFFSVTPLTTVVLMVERALKSYSRCTLASSSSSTAGRDMQVDRAWLSWSAAMVTALSRTLSSPWNPAACAGNSLCCGSQPSHPSFHKFLLYAFVRISTYTYGSTSTVIFSI
jgi:hypothetical protein